MKINLGCGADIKRGYNNCDKYPINNSVQRVDMDKKLPFKDDSIEEIYTDNSFEHVKNTEFTMKEFYRTLKGGGRLIIIVPHWSHYSAYQAEHMSFFGYSSLLRYYDTEHPNTNSAWTVNIKFKLIKRKLIMPKEFKLLEGLWNMYPYLTELILCKLIPVQEVYIEMEK